MKSLKTFLPIALLFLLSSLKPFAQQVNLLKLVGEDKPKKEHVSNAFKSTRVINSQSMEFLGKGVLDFRILHRFGPVNEGVNSLYGFDEAKTRLGLDYGIIKNLID